MEQESKIRRLPPEEIQKIAAGEVVERPASVLKELLENSIDAGASVISIFIEQAGKRLIRVVDNGCGMSRADALMAFVPHATSKIRSVDDLYSVSSYGFRGEALASIASVSRATLITAEAGHEADATKVECNAGIIESAETTVAQAGCDFSIKDLFCSVPVRLKFLKKDETEWNQLYDLVQAVAFSMPGIHVTLYRDGQVVLNAPAVANVLDRTSQIWEHHHAQHMLALTSSEDGECVVRGVISRPHVLRYNRADILLFVNGRWVKNPNLMKAVLKGYAQNLPDGKFPMAVVFVTVPQDRVDVNVHPRKEEVSFISPGRVESAIVEAIKSTLERSVVLVDRSHEFLGAVKTSAETFVSRPLLERGLQGAGISPFEVRQPLRQPLSTLSFRDSIPQDVVFDFAQRDVAGTAEGEVRSLESIVAPKPLQQRIFDDISQEKQVALGRVVGQMFATYIMVDEGDCLVMVDQHAAHERILYERMKTGFETAISVQLLFPAIVTLPEESCRALESVQAFFAERGIQFEAFGPGKIRVSSFVVDAARCNLTDFFSELALAVREEKSLTSEQLRTKIYEHIHSHAACKAAVKAGDVLSLLEMNQLLADLQSVENRHMCIHGRPTTWRIPKKDIEKNFRRI